jgi:hypothetical protein
VYFVPGVYGFMHTVTRKLSVSVRFFRAPLLTYVGISFAPADAGFSGCHHYVRTLTTVPFRRLDGAAVPGQRIFPGSLGSYGGVLRGTGRHDRLPNSMRTPLDSENAPNVD